MSKIPACTCAYGPRVNLEFHATWCEFRRFYEAEDMRDHWLDEEAKERRLERREARDV